MAIECKARPQAADAAAQLPVLLQGDEGRPGLAQPGHLERVEAFAEKPPLDGAAGDVQQGAAGLLARDLGLRLVQSESRVADHPSLAARGVA